MKTRVLLIIAATLLSSIAFAQLNEYKITPNIQEQSNFFGTTVEVDGNYAYIASNLWEAQTGGRVRIYHQENDNWIEIDEINEDATCGYGYNFGNEYGYSLSASGNYLMVGAPAWDSDCLGNIGPDGSAFIYKRNGAQWELQDHLADPDFHVTERFGSSVAIDGEWALAGASQKNLDGQWEQEGAAFFYKLNEGTGNWDYNQMVFASDNQPEDKFGIAVDMENDWAIIGAKKEDEAGDRAGAAYVYHYDGNQWQETQKLVAASVVEFDRFGTSVDISGQWAVIGTENEKTYVYKLVGDEWVEHQTLTEEWTSSYGEKIAISGEFIVIGDENIWFYGQNTGKAFLYELNTDNWDLVEELTPSDGENGDKFGGSVSISGGKTLVGAYYHDDQFMSDGAAYVYSGYSEEPSITANFSFNPMIAAATTPVSFFDESQAEMTEINSWSWDFDNDGIEDSDEPNPVHQYALAGTYPVTLTVSDGTISDSKTRFVTILSASSDTCIAYIPFDGLEATHQGTAAWNTDGNGPEPAKWGHDLPSPPASIEWAYYYMASRDYDNIDPDAPYGMAGNGATANWPQLAQALIDYGKTPHDLEISFGLMSLGDDIEGVDWWLEDNIETRIYQGGTYHIRLDGEDMLTGEMPDFTMEIIYRQFMGEEDIILGETGFDLPQINSQNSSEAAQAIAEAFLNDCNGEPVRFMFSSVQSANQFEFSGNGRYGGFFEVQQGFILKSCGCDLTVEASEDIWLNPNEEAFISAMPANGEEPYEYQWTPGEGLDDPTSSSPLVSIDETTTYTVTVTDATGCQAQDSVTVNIANMGMIYGYVTDLITGDSLDNALLELTGPTESSTVTTFNGYYQFNHVLPSDNYKIVVTRDGYPPDSVINMEVNEFDTIQVDFQLGNVQMIEMASGYNFGSSYFMPDDPDMMMVLEELLNEDLEFVRNGAGNMLHKIGGNWVNGIGDWNTLEGYIFKMNNDAQFGMYGDIIDPETPIELETGYQFVSYLPTQAYNALDAFAGILGDELGFIRNDQGDVLHKIGNEWINGIGNAEPSEGYLIKMNAPATLIYQTGLKSASVSTEKPMEHIRFKGGNPAEPVYTLYLDPGNVLEAGDEVAAFDGEKMVGALRIQDKSWKNNQMAIYNQLLDEAGYNPGDPVTLKVFRNGTLKELAFEMISIANAHAAATFPGGDGEYGLAAIKRKAASTDENNTLILSIYPNPATDKVQISSNGVMDELNLLNQQGQLIRKLNPGREQINLNVNELPQGIYYIRMISKGTSYMKKLLIK